MGESHVERSDVTIYPNIEGYGLLDFKKYQEIAESGYAAAFPKLRDWLASDDDAAQRLRGVLAGERHARHLSEERKRAEEEYGSREHYAAWRQIGGRARHAALAAQGRARHAVKEAQGRARDAAHAVLEAQGRARNAAAAAAKIVRRAGRPGGSDAESD